MAVVPTLVSALVVGDVIEYDWLDGQGPLRREVEALVAVAPATADVEPVNLVDIRLADTLPTKMLWMAPETLVNVVVE